MSNGTLDLEVIKQNVLLYASLINTSIKMTENPELYKDKLTAFYRTDVSEKEKAENFLDLIIENPEDRQIYMDRWESVKQADVFQNNDKKSEEKKEFALKDKNEFIEKEKQKKEEFQGKDIYKLFDERRNISEITLDNNLMIIKKENFLEKFFKKIISIFKHQ